MSTIKEKKEFFTNTNTQGEEINFDKNRQGGNTGFRLFKNGNYPDESAFEKLFSSILFGLNITDRAKSTGENTQTNSLGVEKVVGGHSTIATDDEAKSFDNGDEALYTRTTRPAQLPETLDGLEQEITIEEEIYEGKMIDTNNLSVSDPRNIYQSSLNEDFLAYLKGIIEESIDPVGAVKAYYGTKEQLQETNKKWLFLDGSNIAKETGVNIDFFGEQYRKLYFQINLSLGIDELSVITAWDSNVPLTLPDMRGIYLQGAGEQNIGAINHSGIFGQVSTQTIPEHNHTLDNTVSELNYTSGLETLDVVTNTEVVKSINEVTQEIKPASLALNYIIKY